MSVYALTGGIACGKSFASNLLRRMNWVIIDTDEVAHRLMQRGQVNHKKIVDAFGKQVVNDDGSINRRALGQIVFAESSIREKLNALTHPAIRETWQKELNESHSRESNRPHAVAIPLLFECDLQTLLPTIICVACSNTTQWSRLMERGWTAEHARQRLNSQWSIQRKMENSDFVLWNEGTETALRSQITHLN